MQSSRLATAAATLIILGAAHSSLQSQVASTDPTLLARPPVTIDVARGTRDPFCGTAPRGREELTSRPRVARPRGTPLWFRQEPALITPSHTGGVRLAEFTVSGDVPTLQFARYDSRTATRTIETWTRTTTAVVNSHLVSVFEPAWDAAFIADLLSTTRRGVDQPVKYFGRVLSPDEGEVDRSVPIYLRLGVLGVPPTDVVVVDDTAQYASHVVNLVLPAFDLDRTDLDFGFDLEGAAKRFFQLFADQYEVVSFVPVYSYPSTYAAFHRDTQNAVRGIGASVFNQSSRYGSTGTLLGVEVFGIGSFAANDIANHELTHTWGHNYDWTGIAGAGTRDAAHAPLMTGGESLVGLTLDPWYRISTAGAVPAIELTPVYARQHPLELYAMGLIGPTDVPAMQVFRNQAQFDETPIAVGPLPDPEARAVSIDDIMRRHGPREGPVFTSVRRATVIVSRDRLLSRDEMAYWNFVAARQADPHQTGMFDYDGQASFDFATGLRVDLDTTIRPLNADPAPVPAFQLDFTPFDVRECSGIEFDAPLPSRFTVGQRVKLTGRVTATDRSDFHQILVRYWRRGGTSSNAVTAWTEVSRSGAFALEYEFRTTQEGVYLFEAFLFWPGSGTQWSRCALTTTTVTSAVAAP